MGSATTPSESAGAEGSSRWDRTPPLQFGEGGKCPRGRGQGHQREPPGARRWGTELDLLYLPLVLKLELKPAKPEENSVMEMQTVRCLRRAHRLTSKWLRVIWWQPELPAPGKSQAGLRGACTLRSIAGCPGGTVARCECPLAMQAWVRPPSACFWLSVPLWQPRRRSPCRRRAVG
ncbi:uncharacterized protein WM294_014751 [Sarcoramphus papa]